MAMSHSPATTSAALPLEEPPADRFGSCGLSSAPVTEVWLPPEEQRCSHTDHEVAERRQIVAAEIQVVGFGDARQFRQRRLAQNAGRRRRRGWRLDGRLGGHTNGRCRGDDGCRYPGRPGVKETTTRIVWR